jgi:hypothetical protein
VVAGVYGWRTCRVVRRPDCFVVVLVSVQFTGLDQLIRELTDAPEHIRADGMVIVREETEGARAEVENEYAVKFKRKTGNLSKRVKTLYPSTTLLVGIVQSTAPHSHLVEFGTKQRRNAAGANRGSVQEQSPKITPVIAEKRRARMYRRLKEMLAGMGFQVSGN